MRAEKGRKLALRPSKVRLWFTRCQDSLQHWLLIVTFTTCASVKRWGLILSVCSQENVVTMISYNFKEGCQKKLEACWEAASLDNLLSESFPWFHGRCLKRHERWRWPIKSPCVFLPNWIVTQREKEMKEEGKKNWNAWTENLSFKTGGYELILKLTILTWWHYKMR